MPIEGRENISPRIFRLCQQCGRPTPAQLPECINCGARSLQAVVEHDMAHAEQRFARAYFSRATPLTYGILLLNSLIYLLMIIVAGGNFAEHFVAGVDPATLIAFGAKTNELLQQRGEWFRLVTPIFIHGGLIHIASNSYALWIIGPQVERLYGSARFFLIYLLSGVGGVIGSYFGSSMLGRNPTIPSVGASGAIFGLFGVLAVFGYKYRHELPPTFRRAFGASVFPVIAINLLIGFSVPVIDNGAHIGGLICGALLTFLIPYIAPGKERVSRFGLIILILCVTVITYCFERAWQHSPQHLARRFSTVEAFLESLNEANQVMDRSLRVKDEVESKQRITSEIDQVIAKLEAARAPDAKSDQIRREFADILRAQQAALNEKTQRTHQAKLNANAEAFVRLSQELRQWVMSEGPRLGIVETRPERK